MSSPVIFTSSQDPRATPKSFQEEVREAFRQKTLKRKDFQPNIYKFRNTFITMASPQYTGPQQPQYGEQPGMQPPQEKTYLHQGMPQPQYPEQQMPQRQYAQQPMPQSTYASATPLVSLQQGPAPVDCPMCRVRQMTRVEFVSGGTTQ